MLALAAPAGAAADPAALAGQNVAEVRLFRDGRPLLDFIETRPGQPVVDAAGPREPRPPVQPRRVRRRSGQRRPPWRRASACATTWCRSAARAGWRCSTPAAAPSRRRRPFVRRRLGSRVAPDQVDDAAALLDQYYRDAGRFAARIRPRPPAPSGRLVIDVDPGPAARIGSIEVRGVESPRRPVVLNRLGVREGGSTTTPRTPD